MRMILAIALMLSAACSWGQDAESMEFDGTTQHVAVVDFAENSAMSFACWVKKTDVVGTEIILQNRATDSTAAGYQISAVGAALYVRGSSITAIADVDYFTGEAGNWVHVAVTISGNVAVIYKNGVETWDGNVTTIVDSAYPLYIGRYGDTATNFYQGSIADPVRIYSYALSAGEVATLYAEQAQWRNFDGTYDTSTLLDVSGNGANATVVGTNTFSGGEWSSDGVSGYLRIPVADMPALTDTFTIAMKVSDMDSVTQATTHHLFCQKDAFNDVEGIDIQWRSNWNADYLALSGKSGSIAATEDGVITDDADHIIAITKNGVGLGNTTIYVDGVEQALVSDTLEDSTATAVLDTLIGAYFVAGTPAFYVAPTMDWFGIYAGTAMTSNQVATEAWPSDPSVYYDFSTFPLNAAMKAAGEWPPERSGITNLLTSIPLTPPQVPSGVAIMDVRDSSGSNNHGTLEPTRATGPTWVASVDGRNGVYDFDGADYIDMGIVLGVGANDFTLSGRIKTTSTAQASLICKHAGTGNGYKLYYITSGTKLMLLMDDGPQGLFYSDATTFADDEWHHIAASVDRDGNVSFYNDGVNIGDVDVSARSGNLDAAIELVIGYNSEGSEFFDGQIDDVFIYDSALTSNQVYNLYLGTEPTNTPVLRMDFDNEPFHWTTEDGAHTITSYPEGTSGPTVH